MGDVIWYKSRVFMLCLCNLGFIIHKNVQFAAYFDPTSNAKHGL